MSRNFKKVKAVLLREEWQPSERCYVLLENKGISREFAGHCIESFKLHFLDSGVARPGWDRSFLRWVKGDWEKADKRAFYKKQNHPQIDLGNISDVRFHESAGERESREPRLQVVPDRTEEERNALMDKFIAGLELGD